MTSPTATAAARRAKGRTRVSRGVRREGSERTEASASKHVAQAAGEAAQSEIVRRPRAARAAARAEDADRAPTGVPTALQAHRVDCSRRWPSTPRTGARGGVPSRRRAGPAVRSSVRRMAAARRSIPPSCGARAGRCGYAGLPTRRSGAMLESMRNPCAASISRAQGDRSLIDHSGARNSSMSIHAGSGERAPAADELVGELVLGQLVDRGDGCGRAIRCRGRPKECHASDPDAALPPSPGRRTWRECRGARADPAAVAWSRPRGWASDGQCSNASGPPTPQMWNHSSTSTLNPFTTTGASTDAGQDEVPPRDRST